MQNWANSQESENMKPKLRYSKYLKTTLVPQFQCIYTFPLEESPSGMDSQEYMAEVGNIGGAKQPVSLQIILSINIFNQLEDSFL